ncbi:maleylacetate reductase [Bauldia sp.]|uniref:maleylacetate reductase n=1 Tax=Bauldia sp. TaxID=2575872 RepID=UPI003BAC3696
MRFVYSTLPSRVVFGAGRVAEIADEVARLGVTRALVLSTPGRAVEAEAVAETLGERAAGVFAGARMHTPIDVTEHALAVLREKRADSIVSFGGGSTIGLGKALAYRTDLPQVAIPTTYAGSEVTPILGQTEAGKKTTLTSPKVLPETVIYDPDLTRGLPPSVAGPSGVNAIAHAVEALYAEEANPITSMMAEEAIRRLARSLPKALTSNDNEARADTLCGAWLAGVCLATAGMALHHKICHVLGGTFDLAHADIHCLMLPYAAAYNREAAPKAMARIGDALAADDAPAALRALSLQVGRYEDLQAFGLMPADLDRAADLAVEKPYYNPRPVTRDDVRAMLQAAYEGAAP